jgi:hypothetical protein
MKPIKRMPCGLTYHHKFIPYSRGNGGRHHDEFAPDAGRLKVRPYKQGFYFLNPIPFLEV